MTAGKTVTELWLMSQELSPVDIIPPWFSKLIYHLARRGDK
jgi:hypothetical protein